ncbi:hypothetical protein [Kordia sp. SMS9]|uniref:hypothetical protein n=1 Tax=Kordia sp. SMS9 TaxID=2282170 RepID=UPI0013B4157F|nr:hypothetical protein [Kordia sp. SMS9]
MQHDCRVIYMEKMLNEWFGVQTYDPMNHQETRKVYIGDGFKPKKTYLFQDYEQKPVYVFLRSENTPVFIYVAAEFIEQFFNFIVWIPIEYVFNETILKAKINYYKLAGKQYKIERY